MCQLSNNSCKPRSGAELNINLPLTLDGVPTKELGSMPFPIILIQEYARRFQQKSKNEIIKDLKYHTQLALKKTQEIGKLAKKHTSVDDLTKQKTQEIIEQAKRKGYTIGEKISITHRNFVQN